MVCVVSLYMPGPNTSATLPSLTNTAICDSRTVSEAPYWISMSAIGKRQASVPSSLFRPLDDVYELFLDEVHQSHRSLLGC